MGTLSPNPWDLSLYGLHLVRSGGAAPLVLTPRSALRSHPCVAVSSAEVMSSINLVFPSPRLQLARRAAGTL